MLQKMRRQDTTLRFFHEIQKATLNVMVLVKAITNYVYLVYRV